jgi:hypothetical protein
MASSLPSQEALKLARGNRRGTVRYRCAPATAGKLYIADDHEHQHAWISNISRTGLGLLLTRTLPVGTFVVVQMRSLDRTRVFDLPAHVVHVTLVNQTDWLIGCDLIHALTSEDLDLLL